MDTELERQGKLAWAEQEFEAVRTAEPAPPRAEPWRRTSGIHKVRGRRELAAVRALWQARDEYARQRDIAPGRVLPDSSIVRAARANPATEAELTALPVFGGRQQRRRASLWLRALHGARRLDEDELPSPASGGDGPPPANRWSDRDPDAAARLAAARSALSEIAEHLVLPVENLLLPDSVRRLCWQPPQQRDAATIAEWLRGTGAREWQVELTAEALARALSD